MKGHVSKDGDFFTVSKIIFFADLFMTGESVTLSRSWDYWHPFRRSQFGLSLQRVLRVVQLPLVVVLHADCFFRVLLCQSMTGSVGKEALDLWHPLFLGS